MANYKWKIYLSSEDHKTLECLSSIFKDPILKVEQEERNNVKIFYLTSTVFDNLEKDEDVREQATGLVQMIERLIWMLHAKRFSMEIGSIEEYKNDRLVGTYIQLISEMGYGSEMSVYRLDPEDKPMFAEEVERIIQKTVQLYLSKEFSLASQKTIIGLLQLLKTGLPDTLPALFVVYEIIKTDLDRERPTKPKKKIEKYMEEENLAKESEINDFTNLVNNYWYYTKNNPTRDIMQLRHAERSNYTPGDLKDKAPLSISQAKIIIGRLLINWLDYRLSKS